MVDTLTPEERSRLMSRIRSRNTKPECVLRSVLHRMGYRFSLRSKHLPGKPDIVMPKYKTVIFVHGCFWHRHPGCKQASNPKSNQEFWNEKFRRNVERDKRVRAELEALGWRVVVVWECEIEKRLEEIAAELNHLLSGKTVRYEDFPTTRALFKAAEKKAEYRKKGGAKK